MGKNINLKKGDKYGRLTVIGLEKIIPYKNPNGRTHNKKYYKCECECGNITTVYQGKLVSGQTKSCGCISHKHNLYRSRLYNIYRGILKRCYSKKQKDFCRYGDRNISVCSEWKENFVNFYNWAIANDYNANLTIDRIDVSGNYEPYNCRWVNQKVQANNRRNNRIVYFNGESHNVTEWAELLGIPRYLIYQRLNAGWEVNEVFSKNGKRRI